jgi:hypothetical protein
MPVLSFVSGRSSSPIHGSKRFGFVQNDPQYKDKTALVLPTDHGHGDTVKAWTSHGNKFEGSSGIYFALWDQKLKVREK